MKIFYIGPKGKLTEDAAKAIHGETPEPRAPRFVPSHNGLELIWTEQEIGLPIIDKPKKK